MGLLGAALLLELASEAPSLTSATTLAIVLVGLKDEGIAHLAAALAGAASYRGSIRGLPAAFRGGALGGLAAFGAWQLAVSLNHVGRDHAGLTPAFAWSLSLAPLLVRHATELTSWGLFWPAVIVVAVVNRRSPTVRAFAVAVALNLACVAAMLVVGPPRVRAFAENGTLLNRVLVQLWPFATGLVLSTVAKK